MMSMTKNIKRINIEVFVKNIFDVENGCFREEVNEMVNVYGRMLKEQVRAVECSDEVMISNTLNVIFKEMVMGAKMCGFYHIVIFIVFCMFFDEHHKQCCRGYTKEKLENWVSKLYIALGFYHAYVIHGWPLIYL